MIGDNDKSEGGAAAAFAAIKEALATAFRQWWSTASLVLPACLPAGTKSTGCSKRVHHGRQPCHLIASDCNMEGELHLIGGSDSGGSRPPFVCERHTRRWASSGVARRSQVPVC